MTPGDWIALGALALAALAAFAAFWRSQGAQSTLLKDMRTRIVKHSDSIRANDVRLIRLEAMAKDSRRIADETLQIVIDIREATGGG